MTHRLRSSRTSVHITNLGTADYGPNAGEDTGKGYVTYSPESHCPALSRRAHHMAEVVISQRTPSGVARASEWSTPAEALQAAELYAQVHNVKLCATCARKAHERRAPAAAGDRHAELGDGARHA